MTLQTASSCSCALGRELVGGRLPEYMKDAHKAAQRFLEYYAEFEAVEIQDQSDPWDRPRYWAVHLNGAHVIAVEP